MKDAELVRLTTGHDAIVSSCDAERVRASGKWFSVPKASGRYACRGFGANNRVYLHRFILDAPHGVQVDHINGDTLDNRRENLRLATHSENQRNREGAQKNSKSGVRGVHWNAARGKWEAAIRHHGKRIHLGLFDDIKAAQQARQRGERELWSEADRSRAMITASEAK